MNITLVISSLRPGGAERVITGMANWWVEKGHRVTILTYIDEKPYYPLNPRVDVNNFYNTSASKNILSGLLNNIKIISKLRSAIISSKPDIVISFIDSMNILSLLSTIGLRYKVIISERTNPEVMRIGFIRNRVRTIIYPRATAIAVQTNSVKKWALKIFDAQDIAVIPNSIDNSRKIQINEARKKYKSLSNPLRLASLGRLSKEKGHDILLKSFAIILKKYPDLMLDIIGDGNEREALVNLAKELNILPNIVFHGYLTNPFPIIQKCDVFILPSRIEGFPNALMEAMALGKAVVSFDCNYGPSELIIDNQNGFLVQQSNIEELTIKVEQLLENENLRNYFSNNARKIIWDYSEDRIMALWDDLVLHSLCK